MESSPISHLPESSSCLNLDQSRTAFPFPKSQSFVVWPGQAIEAGERAGFLFQESRPCDQNRLTQLDMAQAREEPPSQPSCAAADASIALENPTLLKLESSLSRSMFHFFNAASAEALRSSPLSTLAIASSREAIRPSFSLRT
jgi:hypothetical protein